MLQNCAILDFEIIHIHFFLLNEIHTDNQCYTHTPKPVPVHRPPQNGLGVYFPRGKMRLVLTFPREDVRKSLILYKR